MVLFIFLLLHPTTLDESLLFIYLFYQVCEAGLHISLGVGLRLYNLLHHDCQTLDLQLALAADDTDDEVSQAAAHLLSDAQALEKEVDNIVQDIENHQAVHDYVSACSEAEPGDTNNDEEHQLRLLSELIYSLQNEVANKVLIMKRN